MAQQSTRDPVGLETPTPRVAVETNGINAGWLDWQGYLLGAVGLGGKEGAWAYANLGVLVALLVGLLGTLALRRPAVRAQETIDR
jgi:hypothetical protein